MMTKNVIILLIHHNIVEWEMISFIIVIDIYNDMIIRYFMKMLLIILFCVIQEIKKILFNRQWISEKEWWWILAY